MNACLRAAREVLEGGVEVDTSKGVVRGLSGDVPIEVRFVTRGAGSYSESWTEVEAPVELKGLLLSVRPQTEHEEALVREGLAIDLRTNDAAFDDAFVVEAAPADVTLSLLNAEIRAELRFLQTVSLLTGESALRLEQREWESDVGRLRVLVKLVAKIARGVPDAGRTAGLAPAGYRGPVRGSDDGRRQEIVALRELQTRRALVLRRRDLVALVIVLIAVVLISILIAMVR